VYARQEEGTAAAPVHDSLQQRLYAHVWHPYQVSPATWRACCYLCPSSAAFSSGACFSPGPGGLARLPRSRDGGFSSSWCLRRGLRRIITCACRWRRQLRSLLPLLYACRFARNGRGFLAKVPLPHLSSAYFRLPAASSLLALLPLSIAVLCPETALRLLP